MMKIENGLVFRAEGYFEKGDIYIKDGRFVEHCHGDVLDAEGLYVVPGLVDIHFHGCVGEDFSDASPEGLAKMAEYLLKNGITAICPTTMSLSVEELKKVMQVASSYERGEGATLVGVNLEGPFLSEKKAGAQRKSCLIMPDKDMLEALQMQAKGLIKLVTVAPELPGAIDFIREAKEQVRVSLGHSGADYETAVCAFAEGASHVTHLYNAMEPLGHRNPGLIGAALDKEDVMVELIADGVHVHPAMVRATFQMFGAERIILISDSMRACGLADGEYTLGGQCVYVEGKRALLKDGTIAGSVYHLMDMVRSAVGMGIPLEDAIRCASINPARALGIFDSRGSLNVGRVADAVLLDKDLNIRYIIQEGRVISCE